MGHIPEDENFEEFLDASAESWSEPDEPEPDPGQEERTDRWGSPIPDEDPAPDTDRWGSEPVGPAPAAPGYELPEKKSGNRWWIIAIIVLVVLCLCACAVFGLPLLGLNIFSSDMMQF